MSIARSSAGEVGDERFDIGERKVDQVFAAVVDQNRMMEETLKQLEGTLQAVSTLKEVTDSLAEVLSTYRV